MTEPTTLVKSGGRMVDVDASIADLVRVLNENGYPTVASCSGHGNRPGNIALADGRELVIARNFKEGRMIDKLFPDIHGRKKVDNIKIALGGAVVVAALYGVFSFLGGIFTFPEILAGMMVLAAVYGCGRTIVHD